jgi:predicted membrane protein
MKKINFSSIVCGLTFLLAGVLLILFNAGVLPMEYKKIIFSWQMLLIVIGLPCIFSSNNKTFGVILICVGGFFLMQNTLYDIALNGWAIALIAIGAIIISNAFTSRRYVHKFYVDNDAANFKKYKYSRGNESEVIDYNAVFSGVKERCDIKNFRGGEITSVFGGAKIDLSKSELAQGCHHLELTAVFGDITIYVPDDWNILIRKTQVFGGFSDNRPTQNFETQHDPTLIIVATAVFGGGKIKCRS